MLRAVLPEETSELARLGAATFVETFGHLYSPEDLAAFLANSRSEAAYATALAQGATRAWLAFVQSGEPPVGYCLAGRCKLPVEGLSTKAGEIRELYVLAAYQQHRLGTQLLMAALEWLQAQGRTPLHVGVWSKNHGAQRLYQRFGFKKTGEYDFPVGDHIDREFILTR